MAKKPARRKQVHPARQGNVIAFPRRGTTIARLDALEPEYLTWSNNTVDKASAEWAAVGYFLRDYAALAPFPAIDALEPMPLADLLDAAELEMPDAPGMMDDLVDNYPHFLHDTGRWTRTQEEFDAVHDLVSMDGDDAEVPEFKLELPDFSPEEAWRQWEAIPLIRWARALLEWLGDGREVTPGRLLRLRDVEPAALAVEVHARGVRNAKRTPVVPLRTAPLPPPATGTADAPLELGTMADVPRLMDLWNALLSASAIDLGSTRVWPGDRAHKLLSGDIDERNEAAFTITLGYVAGLMDSTIARPIGGERGALVGVFLSAAASSEPPAANALDDPPGGWREPGFRGRLVLGVVDCAPEPVEGARCRSAGPRRRSHRAPGGEVSAGRAAGHGAPQSGRARVSGSATTNPSSLAPCDRG